MDNTDKILYCKCCKYQANFLCEFNKHLKTQKHQRAGKKKDYKCTNCSYVATTHWNQKMHIVLKHYTIEQKKQLKYYCSLCDSVNFSSLYYDNHIKSTLHKNNILKEPTIIDISIPNQSIDNINENIKQYIETALDNTRKDIFNYIDKIINK